MNAQNLAFLAAGLSLGLLLQILACVFWNNWWPLLTAFLYIVVPMPYLFFGSGSCGEHSELGGSGWMECGKFLSGFSGIGALGVPSMLAHAGMITPGALALALMSAVVTGCTVVVFDRLVSREDYGYGYGAF